MPLLNSYMTKPLERLWCTKNMGHTYTMTYSINHYMYIYIYIHRYIHIFILLYIYKEQIVAHFRRVLRGGGVKRQMSGYSIVSEFRRVRDENAIYENIRRFSII